jgi:hypothetical protein
MVPPARKVIDRSPEARADYGADSRNCRDESALTSGSNLQFLHAFDYRLVVLDVSLKRYSVAVEFTLKPAKVAAHIDEQIVYITV